MKVNETAQRVIAACRDSKMFGSTNEGANVIARFRKSKGELRTLLTTASGFAKNLDSVGQQQFKLAVEHYRKAIESVDAAEEMVRISSGPGTVQVSAPVALPPPEAAVAAPVVEGPIVVLGKTIDTTKHTRVELTGMIDRLIANQDRATAHLIVTALEAGRFKGYQKEVNRREKNQAKNIKKAGQGKVLTSMASADTSRKMLAKYGAGEAAGHQPKDADPNQYYTPAFPGVIDTQTGIFHTAPSGLTRTKEAFASPTKGVVGQAQSTKVTGNVPRNGGHWIANSDWQMMFGSAADTSPFTIFLRCDGLKVIPAHVRAGGPATLDHIYLEIDFTSGYDKDTDGRLVKYSQLIAEAVHKHTKYPVKVSFAKLSDATYAKEAVAYYEKPLKDARQRLTTLKLPMLPPRQTKA